MLSYFKMDVVALQLALGNKGSLQRSKLCTLWDASLGEHPTKESVNV